MSKFPTRGDKAIRAQSMRGRIALERLYVPAGAPIGERSDAVLRTAMGERSDAVFERLWLADLSAELLAFPAGRHDDQVDAIGLIGQLLDRMLAASTPKRPDRPPRESWSRARDHEEVNWEVV